MPLKLPIDLRDLSQINQMVHDIEGVENRDRKRQEWKSYNIYAGNQRKYVKKMVEDRFPISYHSMSISNINILKKVVDKKAKAYKQPPKRLINDSESESLSMVYDEFDQPLKQMDVIYNRHKTCLMWVQNNPLMPTEYRLRAMAPYLFDVIINPDTLIVECVILSYPDFDITTSNVPDDRESKTSTSDGINQLIAESQNDSGSRDGTVYSIWTADQHAVVQAKEKRINGKLETVVDFVLDDNNKEMINPLGMLPFVFLTTDPDKPEFPISSPLPFESININSMKSTELTGAEKQTMGQLVLKYPEGSDIKQTHTGFDVMIKLPQKLDPEAPPTEAQYINAAPDLPGIRQSLAEYAEAVISDEGLQNFSLAGSEKEFASGLDRALAMADVTEIRKENQQLYTKVEQQIFEIIKRYDLLNGTKLFGQEDEIEVQFTPPRILQSEGELLNIIKMKLDMGLIQKFEALMILDPNLKDFQAMEKLELIEQEKLENVNRFMQRNVSANNETTDDEDDQSEGEVPEVQRS